jgi:hypothetical protein
MGRVRHNAHVPFSAAYAGPTLDAASFGREVDFVRGVQFGLMVVGDNAQLQRVFARLDAVECPFGALEHAYQLAVDVGMSMMAALAFDQFKLDGDFVAFDQLTFCWRENFDARALGRLQRRRRGFRAAWFSRRLFGARMIMLR